jgi:glycosyltransferase involved in cell wall biosynthesis
MVKILILTSGHICNLPRSQKEAETLANAGYDVTVRGFWSDPELVKRDRLLTANKQWRFIPIVDIQTSNIWQNLFFRGQTRISRELFQHFGIFSPELLGYGVQKMLKVARQTRADLTIVHLEAGLWVGNQLLDEGFPVGVDIEDWFSEDLLPEARRMRPVSQLKALEGRLIRECSYCLTTSQAMAEALAKTYQAPQPEVIYNSFPWQEREKMDGKICDRQNLHLPSLHWFSQVIGQGRGLEILFQALPHIQTPVEIHLRGNYPESSRQWLESLIPVAWQELIFIHPTVPNSELLSRIAEHDIGLALEIPYCLSRQYTATNKIFQYLQAGLAVVATDTAGQQEIFNYEPTIGKLVPSNNPLALAQAIEELLNNPEQLLQAKYSALKVAKNQFCWEQQSSKLLALVEKAIKF